MGMHSKALSSIGILSRLSRAGGGWLLILLEDLFAQSEGNQIIWLLFNSVSFYSKVDSPLRKFLQVVHFSQVSIGLDLDWYSHFDWVDENYGFEMSCLKNVLQHSKPLLNDLK